MHKYIHVYNFHFIFTVPDTLVEDLGNELNIWPIWRPTEAVRPSEGVGEKEKHIMYILGGMDG